MIDVAGPVRHDCSEQAEGIVMASMWTGESRRGDVVLVDTRWLWHALTSYVRYGDVRGSGSPP
jgi:hypothetical protein